MVNYWALQIGINQYRFLPPLSYAQRDAEQLLEVLTQSGMPSQHCRLFVDPPTAGGDSRLPTAQNIQAQLTQYQQVMQPKDLLLLFFSGYGLAYQGKDYLMPIEGDPHQVAATGLAIESLFQAFQAAGVRSIVILDANRSQLGLEQGGFGVETLELAQQYGIAVLLSCQPHQFAHEPLTLRQGLFTTALIEAIQTAGCATVEQLVQFVGERLPQLSEECWRPRQDLFAYVPPQLRYQMLLPDLHRRQLAQGAIGSGRGNLTGIMSQLSVVSRSGVLQTGSNLTQGLASWLSRFTKPQPALPLTESGTLTANWSQPRLDLLDLTDRPARATQAAQATTGVTPPNDEFVGRRLLVQGGLIAAILLFGVILRNSNALLQSANQSLEAIDPAAATLSPLPSPAAPADAESILPIDPDLQFKLAKDAFQAQQFEEANRRLSRISAASRTPEQAELFQQTNQALLDTAKTMLIRIRQPRSENQVSDFVEAIRIARLIKPDQPLYAQAQQDIDRWSRVILDMAQGRAARPDGDSALDVANNYKTAISAARLVPSDQSIYTDANAVISGWSQRILDLANEQAKNGDLDRAIQIGELVPPYTDIYALAQEAIAGWRNQPLPEETALSEPKRLEKAAPAPEVTPEAAPEAAAPKLLQPGPPAPAVAEPQPEPAVTESVFPETPESEWAEPEFIAPEVAEEPIEAPAAALSPEPEWNESDYAEPDYAEPDYAEPE